MQTWGVFLIKFGGLCIYNWTVGRGFSGVEHLSVKDTVLHWTWFSPYSGFQVIFTDIGFHLKSGFKKRLSTQTVIFILIWFHETGIYTEHSSTVDKLPTWNEDGPVDLVRAALELVDQLRPGHLAPGGLNGARACREGEEEVRNGESGRRLGRLV